MFEPPEEQFAESIEHRINERTSELLNTSMLDLFCDTEDAEAYLKELYSAGHLGLMELQNKFRLRMEHEAMATATRQMERSSEITRLSMALQDGNECSTLEMRRS